MKSKIDTQIRTSETHKHIELRPELWNRLERQLDSIDRLEGRLLKKPKRKKTKLSRTQSWLVAASFTLILMALTTYVANSNTYQLEDLNANADPYFTKRELSDLKSYYTEDKSLSDTKKPA